MTARRLYTLKSAAESLGSSGSAPDFAVEGRGSAEGGSIGVGSVVAMFERDAD
jgi:hypothetical protein